MPFCFSLSLSQSRSSVGAGCGWRRERQRRARGKQLLALSCRVQAPATSRRRRRCRPRGRPASGGRRRDGRRGTAPIADTKKPPKITPRLPSNRQKHQLIRIGHKTSKIHTSIAIQSTELTAAISKLTRNTENPLPDCYAIQSAETAANSKRERPESAGLGDGGGEIYVYTSKSARALHRVITECVY